MNTTVIHVEVQGCWLDQPRIAPPTPLAISWFPTILRLLCPCLGVMVMRIHTKGFELFCDLCLADCLATGGTAKRVVIQLKGHPTFVSDAMSKDMMAMIDLLADLDINEYPRCDC